MNRVPFIHRLFWKRSAQFFTDRVTFQTPSVTKDALGGDVVTWANHANLVNLPCAVSQISRRHMPDSILLAPDAQGTRSGDHFTHDDTHSLLLPGEYDIDMSMRAVVHDTAYDITGMAEDQIHATTWLWLKKLDV